MTQDNRYSYLIIPICMALLAVGLVVVLQLADPIRTEAPQIVPTGYQSPTPPPTAEAVSVALTGDFDLAAVSAGERLFQTTCSACHGMNGRGIPGLGKDLIAGEFTLNASDDEVFQVIVNGRQPTDPLNTTGVLMPARGANPSITDEQVHQIITYLRASAAENAGIAAVPTLPQPTLDPNFRLPIASLGGGASDATEEAAGGTPTFAPTAQPTAQTTQVAAAPTESAGETTTAAFDAAAAYNLSCAGCHGYAGEGTEYNGPALAGNILIQTSPSYVFTLLTLNQPPADPRDDFPHPVWGAYPLLDADQLNALIDYARALTG